jgi:PAS domain S-box-containing protein
MFPVGSTAVRLGVAGGVDDVAECFSGWEDETGQSVECLSVHPEQIASGPVSDRRVDCLVIDAETSGVESTAAIEQWTDQRPNRPVVLLVDGWDDTQVADALSAGATEILPKELVDNDPDLFADEVVSAVNEEHAWTSFRELYDSVAGIAMLHDPDSGALIHANRALCDLLGYDRDDVVSMRVGDFTADVPGYDHERAMNVVSSVTDRDDPIEVEWPVTTAEGAVRWIETRLQTVRIGGRELVLWSSVDVTERRRHEREYEQVFDNVNDIISIFDPW